MGQVFAGRYELVDPIASGGAGSVWRVWDRRDQTYVAAKILRHVDSDSLLRFLRETTRRLDHPHVVTPTGWVGEDDLVLFTMPLMRGGSVATLLRDFGALPVGWVCELIRQTLLGLAEVHRNGLVHRDIKPANLLLDLTGRGRPHLRLGDFGAAAHLDDARLTQVGQVVGTPGYLAPEQRAGADPDPRHDVYAVGVVAAQLLTGQVPQERGSAPPVDGVDPGLAGIIARFTATVPQARPATAGVALELWDRACRGIDLGTGAEDEDPVEVFDQMPALPEGWDDGGPRRPATSGTPVPGASGSIPSTPIPVAVWVLCLIGVALILAAILVV